MTPSAKGERGQGDRFGMEALDDLFGNNPHKGIGTMLMIPKLPPKIRARLWAGASAIASARDLGQSLNAKLAELVPRWISESVCDVTGIVLGQVDSGWSCLIHGLIGILSLTWHYVSDPWSVFFLFLAIAEFRKHLLDERNGSRLR